MHIFKNKNIYIYTMISYIFCDTSKRKIIYVLLFFNTHHQEVRLNIILFYFYKKCNKLFYFFLFVL